MPPAAAEGPPPSAASAAAESPPVPLAASAAATRRCSSSATPRVEPQITAAPARLHSCSGSCCAATWHGQVSNAWRRRAVTQSAPPPPPGSTAAAAPAARQGIASQQHSGILLGVQGLGCSGYWSRRCRRPPPGSTAAAAPVAKQHGVNTQRSKRTRRCIGGNVARRSQYPTDLTTLLVSHRPDRSPGSRLGCHCCCLNMLRSRVQRLWSRPSYQLDLRAAHVEDGQAGNDTPHDGQVGHRCCGRGLDAPQRHRHHDLAAVARHPCSRVECRCSRRELLFRITDGGAAPSAAMHRQGGLPSCSINLAVLP